tara:strand:- start:5417 stop:6046 length:630 start_codon:yes stop_codon:yes gene_type:complete
MSLSNKLFVSRKTILEMLKYRNINTDDYDNFSQEELELMYKAHPKITYEINPLDMVFKEKVTVKYVLQPKLRSKDLIEVVDTMIEENVVNEGDTLIFIIRDTMKAEDTIELNFENVYQNKKVFVQMFDINKLMFNVTKHNLVPKHVIMSEEEKNNILKVLNLDTPNQLQIIKKTDPVAKYLGMKTGQACMIHRISPTAGYHINIRYCEL